jgi:DeoR/GlpR family transcriptional regulator of sugar metabolism
MREAFASRHMGRIIVAYRNHPHHGRTLTQETVGRWLELDQSRLSRLEGGKPPDQLGKLLRWSRTLHIPNDLLWFALEPEASASSYWPAPRGSAVPERQLRGVPGPQPFAERFPQQAEAKERIAAKVAALVGEGGAIGFDASSTVQRLVGHLDGIENLTVVTNGPDTFASLQGRGGVTPLLTGGQLDQRSDSLVGPLAMRGARDLLLRRLFVSAAALDPDEGTTEPTLEEAEVKRALADVADEIVVVVDAGKLNLRGPARVLPPDRVSLLVTELDPADERLDAYRDHWEII